MATRHRRPTILSRLVPPILMIALIVYFVWHGLHGDYGLFARIRLEEDIARLSAARDEIRGQRQALEERVSLLRADPIDADMLDERARANLNLAHPDEIIIYTSPRLAAAGDGSLALR
ncbi:FtsB family cell division protein [Amorphus orientalis]|uniref:Cell division protein FtsB n=1 Tax=Amorphus orientalis TaxID=649198 RepID=A0AAE3VQE6_9HYPH|nr:septum formation initiator family protein [Amorphus orientalis]MDQ0315846.1 cell division protein FtsB [Amorphus orientalis]